MSPTALARITQGSDKHCEDQPELCPKRPHQEAFVTAFVTEDIALTRKNGILVYWLIRIREKRISSVRVLLPFDIFKLFLSRRHFLSLNERVLAQDYHVY